MHPKEVSVWSKQYELVQFSAVTGRVVQRAYRPKDVAECAYIAAAMKNAWVARVRHDSI